MSFGALSDLVVIDLTQMLSGPFATQMLADQGATVIKIEPPKGDMIRPAGPFRADDRSYSHGAYFQSVNRNKLGLCLDLKQEAGKAVLRRLVAGADVVVENFRAGVMDKLGLTYESLAADNPKLVYAALRGFGDPRTAASPYVDWPAFDVTAQAMGGIIGITGPDKDSPTKIGPGVGDIIPGIMLAFGVLAAVHHARRTGQGQFVDVAMTDAVLAVCERMVYQHSVNGAVPGPEGNHHPFLAPFGVFPASDGWITIASVADDFFHKLADGLEAPEWLTDPKLNNAMARMQHKAEVIAAVSARTAQFTKAELTGRLGGKLPYGPVMTIDELARDAHVAAREMIVPIEQPGSARPLEVAGVPVKLSRTPGGVHARAPGLGEHADEVLARFGLSPDQIADLRASGALP